MYKYVRSRAQKDKNNFVLTVPVVKDDSHEKKGA